MLDVFGTAYLNRVIDKTEDAISPLLDRFFPEVEVSNTEKIFFDTKGRDRRLSPFVAPTVKGKIVSRRGFTTDSFQPAYIKDKSVFEPTESFKRRAGEALTGMMTPAQRLSLAVANEVAEKKNRLIRRLETMASEVLRTGKLVISGTGFEAMTVDFLRNVNHTIVLAPGSKWADAGVSPWADLEAWMETVLDNSGKAITDITMDALAYKTLRNDPTFIAALDNRREGSGSSAKLLSVPALGLVHKGSADGVEIWVYTGKYDDPITGAATPYVPANTVIGASSAIEGVRHFGAIKDIKAIEGSASGVQSSGLAAREMFLKSWTEEDPSVRYLMGQSAPLLVPYYVDASFCATVG